MLGLESEYYDLLEIDGNCRGTILVLLNLQ